MKNFEKSLGAAEVDQGVMNQYLSEAAVRLVGQMGDKDLASQVADMANKPGREAFELVAAIFPGSRDILIEAADLMMQYDGISAQAAEAQGLS